MQCTGSPPPDAEAVLEALAAAVLVVEADNSISMANSAAEHLLQTSRSALVGRKLEAIIPPDSLVQTLVTQVRASGSNIADHDIPLNTPRISLAAVSVQVSPISNSAGDRHLGAVVLSLTANTIAQRIDQQLAQRHAGRSVAAMAALLAHEVKNPLAGIRGAAQLLEGGLSREDRELITLICDEVDRINALVDRMGLASDSRGLERGGVNIHEVLERARRVAEAGFGGNVRMIEQYDPSLPPAFANRDQLIQVFVNLIKNACEAAGNRQLEIVLSTAYQHGVRIAVPGAAKPVDLPLMVRVQDNGPGVPEGVREHLFDPFVSGRTGGHGLGLALVAKIVSEHGGLVECDSVPGRTVFTVMLPVVGSREWGEPA